MFAYTRCLLPRQYGCQYGCQRKQKRVFLWFSVIFRFYEDFMQVEEAVVQVDSNVNPGEAIEAVRKKRLSVAARRKLARAQGKLPTPKGRFKTMSKPPATFPPVTVASTVQVTPAVQVSTATESQTENNVVPEKKAKEAVAQPPPATSTSVIQSAKLMICETATLYNIAIVPVEYPTKSLTEKQASEVLAAIQKKALDASPDEDRRFGGYKQEKGVILIICVTKGAIIWLREVIPLLDLPEIGRLRLGLARDILRKTRVTVMLPTQLLATENKTSEFLHQMLVKHNPSLKLNSAVIIGIENQGPQKAVLSLDVDQVALEALKQRRMNLIFGLDMVKATVVANTPQ